MLSLFTIIIKELLIRITEQIGPAVGPMRFIFPVGQFSSSYQRKRRLMIAVWAPRITSKFRQLGSAVVQSPYIIEVDL